MCQSTSHSAYMFSLATPSMSERPLPPQPIQAMCSLSDGARYPRPRTWRGTMVNAAPAATSPTNRLREMRFRAIRRSPSLLSLRIRGPEHHRKEHQHQRRECGGQYPEAAPLLQRELGGGAEKAVEHAPGHLGADEHPEAVCHEHQESLGLAADRRSGALVDVDLTGHEEEVVTHAVQQNADDDQADDRARCGEGEQGVAQ